MIKLRVIAVIYTLISVICAVFFLSQEYFSRDDVRIFLACVCIPSGLIAMLYCLIAKEGVEGNKFLDNNFIALWIKRKKLEERKRISELEK